MRLALAVVGAMGCGRVGFGTVSATTADGGDASVDVGITIPPGAIAYAGSLGGTLITMGSTISLTAHAAQAGDAVVVFFACSGSQMPATGAITGTGWNDAVWAGCYTGTALVSVGAGYTKAADDGNGDWAEYKVTTDPAGTMETAAFSNAAQPWALAAVTLKPN